LTCRRDVTVVIDDVKVEKKRKVLEWLFHGKTSERQEGLQKARTKNSGKWFVNSEEFKYWAQGNGPWAEANGPSCLLCTGIGIPLSLILC